MIKYLLALLVTSSLLLTPLITLSNTDVEVVTSGEFTFVLSQAKCKNKEVLAFAKDADILPQFVKALKAGTVSQAGGKPSQMCWVNHPTDPNQFLVLDDERNGGVIARKKGLGA